MVRTQRVVDLLELGRVRDAAELCSRVLIDSPDNAQLVRLLGHACLILGDHETALDRLNRAAALAPGAAHLERFRPAI